MKKFLFVIMLIFFIVIDAYTALLVLGDMIIPTTTMEITNQNEYIVEIVKEHFDLDYEIQKIVFSPGFPDGYGLDIYDYDGMKHSESEDNHEDSEIFEYFQKMKIDTPKYLKVLILEILLEIIVIVVVIRKNKIKQRNP